MRNVSRTPSLRAKMKGHRECVCSASMANSIKAINCRTWRTVEVTEWLVARKS